MALHPIIHTIVMEHYNDHEANRRYLQHQLDQPPQFRVIGPDVPDEDIKAQLRFHEEAAAEIKQAIDADVNLLTNDEATNLIMKPWLKSED